MVLVGVVSGLVGFVLGLAVARSATEQSGVAAQAPVTEVPRLSDEARAEMDSLRDERDEMETALGDAEDEIERLSTETDSLEADLLAAETEVEGLRVGFEPELRAQAQEEWDAEVGRACESAGDASDAISNHVSYDESWRAIGDEMTLVGQVEACAEPLRARSEAERLADECQAVDVDAVTKDPDGLAGSCYQMFVVPWQWDSRTGECAFLGYFDPSNLGTRSFSYDGDGIFLFPDEVCGGALSDADQDDLLRVWADLIGPFSYDTAAGGTNEIPQFVVRAAELIQKA